MKASNIQTIARNLRLATSNGSPLPTAGIETLDMNLAADIAAFGRGVAVAEGERVVGYKIGLTAAAARASFNADSPVQGYLLESTLALAGGSIATGHMSKPLVEAEIAFIIGEALNSATIGVEDVIAATRAVAPAIEIVDSRWIGGAASLPMLVADNTNAAAAVLGAPVALPANLAEATSLLTVGSGKHPGSTETVLGNPLEAVVWLARHLAENGSGLEPGDIVLSGSMNVPVPLGDATTVTAEISGLGTVHASFH